MDQTFLPNGLLKITRWTAIVAGTFVLLLGLVSCIGWLTNNVYLVYIRHTHSAIQFNTALSFVALGIALLALFWPIRFNLSRWLGLFVFFIGFLSTIEYLYDRELISQFFIPGTLGPQSTAFPGRVSLITALALTISGLGFIFYSKKAPSLTGCFLLASIGFSVLSLGIIAILGFFVPIETNFGLIHGRYISPQAALGFFIFGLGMVAAALYFSFFYSIPIIDKLGSLVTLFGILLTLLICLSLRSSQNKVTREFTFQTMHYIIDHLHEHFRNRIKETERMFVHLVDNHFEFNDLEKKYLRNYLRDTKEVTAIGSVDNHLKVLRIFSLKNFQSLLGDPLFIDSDQENLLKNVDGHPTILASHTYINENAFVIFIPFIQEGVFKAGLFAIIDAPQFLQASTQPIIRDQFSLIVSTQEEQLYGFEVGKPAYSAQVEEAFDLDGVHLNLKLIPVQESYSIFINDSILGLFLFLGVISSFILGRLANLWRSNYLQLQKIESIQQDLNLALSSAQVGTWKWEIPSNRLYWDIYTSHLLGLNSEKFEGSLDDFFSHLQENQEAEKEKLLKAKDQTSTYQSEVKVIWPDHNTHILAFRGSTTKDELDQVNKMTGVCWDITSIRETQKLLEIEYLITNILKESESLESVAPQILEVLCQVLGWNLGVLWINPNQSNQLTCMATWHTPSQSYAHFANIDKQISLSKERSFPGQIWNAQRPVWIEDIKDDTHQLHISEAVLDDLRGAFGFPILDEKGIIGVIELYRLQPLSERMKGDLLNLVSSLGNIIAQFYHRLKYEKSQKELASIVEFSRDAIYSRDLEGKIITWNQGAVDILGYAPEDVISTRGEQLIPPDRKKEFEWLIAEAVKGKVIRDYETQRICKNGKKIWVNMTVSPIRDKQGRPTQLCVILHDIDHLKKTEENLRENEEKFRTFVETTNEWVWAINQERKITYSNPTIHKLLGYLPKEIIGMDAALLLHPGDRDIFIKTFDEALQRKKGWLNQVLRWLHKEGTFRWMEGNAEPNLTPKETIIGLRGSQRDVTERKNLEALKDEFISVVSHELRTPLTSIRGSLALVLGRYASEISSKVHQLLDIGFNNCGRLIKIINDILDVEKMEAGKLTMQLSSLNLIDVIQDSVKAIQSFADKFQISFEIENLPQFVQVNGDYNRLMQVMDNLLSNAVKFSPPGSQVSIGVQKLDSIVKVAVKNQGKGIPKEVQSRIFQKFVQGDAGIGRKVSGTGLGLVITKNIIERMGGTIYFESTPDVETTFYFELPLQTTSMQENHKVENLILKKNILICEKDPILLPLLEEQLAQDQFVFQTTSDLKTAQHLIESQVFNAIILDLDLVSDEEFDLVKNLCKTKINPNLPLFLIHSSQDKRKLDGTLPIIGWLDKPKNAREMAQLIKEFKASISTNRPQILYVEEDEELVKIIKNLLNDELEVTSVASIQEAKKKLAENDYDLVLLDLVLPDGNGSQLLPYMNRKNKTRIPVVIFSAYEPTQQDWLHADCIKQYLVKSQATDEQLIHLIRSLLTNGKENNGN